MSACFICSPQASKVTTITQFITIPLVWSKLHKTDWPVLGRSHYRPLVPKPLSAPACGTRTFQKHQKWFGPFIRCVLGGFFIIDSSSMDKSNSPFKASGLLVFLRSRLASYHQYRLLNTAISIHLWRIKLSHPWNCNNMPERQGLISLWMARGCMTNRA